MVIKTPCSGLEYKTIEFTDAGPLSTSSTSYVTIASFPWTPQSEVLIKGALLYLEHTNSSAGAGNYFLLIIRRSDEDNETSLASVYNSVNTANTYEPLEIKHLTNPIKLQKNIQYKVELKARTTSGTLSAQNIKIKLTYHETP